jgi:hypothetical protein
MIRRGFWLAVGAAGGIMGYRRVTSLGRQLSATLSPAATTDRGQRQAADPAPPGAGSGRPAGVGAASAAGATVASAGAALSGRAGRGLIRGTIRFSRDARMFSRDVREGMDLYMVRHRPQVSPTLGAGAPSRRPSAPPPFSEVPGAPTLTDDRVKDDR